MSLNIAIPSVKCVFVSCYLVIANCRGLAHNKTVTSFGKFKTHLFNNSVNAKNLSTRQRPEEPPWRVIFFGTDDFSLSCLQPLNAKLNTGTLLSSLGVVSQENSLVHKFSASENLPIYQWPPTEDILNNYDMGVVVSYGKLIPEYIINALPLGVLNVHASLLPRWRGAAPIAYAVMNGDAETGITIMLIKPHKFDVGDMVRQYRCSIAPNETTLELRARLAKHAAQLLMECIRDIPRCLDNALPQPNDGITYAPKVSLKLSAVNWEKMTAKRVYDLHRAISYAFPLSTSWYDKPVRLYDIRLTYQPSSEKKTVINTQSSKSALNFLNDTVSENSEIIGNTDSSPGKINYDRKTKIIKIQCADGKWITCEQFKVSTGRIMTPPDFYNGFLSKKDPKDWFF